MALARFSVATVRALRGEAVAHHAKPSNVMNIPAELAAKQAGPWGALSVEEKKQRNLLIPFCNLIIISLPSCFPPAALRSHQGLERWKEDLRWSYCQRWPCGDPFLCLGQGW